MNATLPMIDKRRPLEEALTLLQDKSAPAVAVVESDGRLFGLVTAETLGELMMVREAMPDGNAGRTMEPRRRRERDSMHEPGSKLMRKHRLRTLLGANTAARRSRESLSRSKRISSIASASCCGTAGWS